jgi:hypothetical protein
VKVGIGVGVRVRGGEIDPSDFVDGLAELLQHHGIAATRFDRLVRFSADDAITLAALAEPIAAWWQSFQPSPRGDVALITIGPAGTSELTYCLPERAVVNVRHQIITDCGPHDEAGQPPGAPRRLAARTLRRLRAGFTASEVLVDTADGCLRVAVTGRDLDGQPRSIEFQTPDPADPHYDQDDDEGYCLINEHHIPVFNALESVRLVDDRLRLRLTRAAANLWASPSMTLTIKLRITVADRRRLGDGLRRLFDMSPTSPPRDLHL